MKSPLVSVAAVMAIACSFFFCGSDPGDDTTSHQVPGLSLAFANNCTRCHGDRGEGQTVGGAVYPVIPGGKDESAFIAIVRSGRNAMPAFDEATFSDDDLKSDYLWLTTKRGF